MAYILQGMRKATINNVFDTACIIRIMLSNIHKILPEEVNFKQFRVFSIIKISYHRNQYELLLPHAKEQSYDA